MKSIESLLRNLAREEVTEVAVVSGRLPCARVGGSLDPIDDEPPSADRILEMLVTVGGSRYVDDLGPTPRQWSSRVDGLGVVGVSATMPRDGEVHARFALMRRDARSSPRRETEPERPARRSTQPEPLAAKRRSAHPRSDHAAAARRASVPVKAIALGPEEAVAHAHGRAAASAGGRLLLEPLLETARDARASDLHVVAGRPPLLRVAGELRSKGAALEVDAVERMLMQAVPPRLTDVLAEQGSCDFALGSERLGRFRVNVSRQQTGLKATIRLVPREVPTLETLGLPLAIAQATRYHQGLIVVTGPTGHGKTTTMAAIVDRLNAEEACHIVTVEDPIEFVHTRKKAILSQREVGTHTRSFETALTAALREDPDVIVVGELRDTDTVRMAVTAAETGHLVIGTMNTPSASKTIDRLIDLFPPADQPQVRTSLASGLRLIVSQRLVPSVDRSRLHAAAELLPGCVPLSALIRENKTFQIPSLQQRSKALGIVRLDDALADLVQGLHVSLEAAQAFAESPGELEALVSSRKAPPVAVRSR